MKKVAFFLILIISVTSFKAGNPKVLMFIQDNSLDLEFMLTNEVGKMRQILEQNGFNVDITNITGEALKTESTALIPNFQLSEVNLKNYVGFIIPCMAPKDTIVTPEERSFVRNIISSDKPLAAQTGAVLVLAKAGVLKGKKYAFFEDQLSSEIENGIYSGLGVVQDGNIITSGICPMHAKFTGNKDRTVELTHLLVQAIKEQQ